MKKQNLFKAAVLGAAMMSGVVMAQPAPMGRAQCPLGAAMRGQRCPQGMMNGQQMRQGQKGMLGGQQGMRRGAGAMGERPCFNPERLAAAGVKEEQLAALETFANARRVEQAELQAAVQEAQVALQQAVTAEQVDEKAIAAALDQLNKARSDATLAAVSGQLKMREMIGADVAAKLRSMAPAQGRGFGAPGGGPRGLGPRPGCPLMAPEAK